MFVDFSRNQKRYMRIKLSNGWVLDVEEPNLRTLEKLEIAKETNSVKDLTIAIETIVNKNKQKRKLKREELKDLFETSDMKILLENYSKFIEGIENDPN